MRKSRPASFNPMPRTLGVSGHLGVKRIVFRICTEVCLTVVRGHARGPRVAAGWREGSTVRDPACATFSLTGPHVCPPIGALYSVLTCPSWLPAVAAAGAQPPSGADPRTCNLELPADRVPPARDGPSQGQPRSRRGQSFAVRRTTAGPAAAAEPHPGDTPRMGGFGHRS